ncbi:MAG: SIS domain-containing protein, partial [Mesorhizobium sp.]
SGLANRIRAARRVELFGTGPSSVCADILAMRLICLGFPAHCSGSATVSHALARGLGSLSLAIGISSRGHTVETKDFLAIARETGAYTIAITTRVDCPIARTADEVVLFTSAEAWPQAGSESPPRPIRAVPRLFPDPTSVFVARARVHEPLKR